MTPPVRFPIIDIARGVALGAMVIYHATFDLALFGLIARGTPLQPEWALFARLIAGSFLFLAGVSMILAHGGGLRRAAFWRSTGVVALAALGVSAASTAFTAASGPLPGTVIFFGILHAIVVARILALSLLRAPVWVLALVATLVFAAPYLWQHPVFDTRWLAWIGFSQTVPPSMDFEPLFPWFAPFVLGMIVARLGAVPRWAPGGRIARALAWAGQRSLWIYLIHQPVLIGAIWLYVSVVLRA